MRSRGSGRAAWRRALRAAARLVLCLGLLLLPVAGASAAHAASAVSADGHAHGPDSSAPDAHAPLCHQTGACQCVVAPAAPSLARPGAGAVPEIPAMQVPASAVLLRLLRPPIAAARA